jgi:histone H2A
MPSTEQKAGIIFKVSKLRKKLKEDSYADNVSKTGAIYLAAVLEYLVAEIMEIAGNSASANKKVRYGLNFSLTEISQLNRSCFCISRIIPRHILLSIHADDELKEVLKDVIIPDAGVFPHIEPALLPKLTREKQLERRR